MDGGPITVTKDDIPGVGEAPSSASDEPAVALVGDPVRGKEVYFGKGICFTCHVVGGEGQAVGPDLTEIALINTLDYIQESILEPNKVVVSGYPPIMPAGFGDVLNANDFNDLVAYLMTLKGGEQP